MRIGIFGGTFDPPHVGHQILAAEALDQLQLNRLLWVLTPDPPHKQDQRITPLEVRLDLTRAAVGGNPRFVLSRVEIDRPGPHYSLDTVRLVGQEYPGAELIYLIGGDSLHDMPGWHRPRELVAQVGAFGVMRRPGDEVNLDQLEAALPGLTQKILWIDAPRLEISSSGIRERVRAGRMVRYYLPVEVYNVIRRHNLYRE